MVCLFSEIRVLIYGVDIPQMQRSKTLNTFIGFFTQSSGEYFCYRFLLQCTRITTRQHVISNKLLIYSY